MKFLVSLLLVALLASLDSASAQANLIAISTGLWFCNFYPSAATLSVFRGATATGSAFVVPYQACNYLPQFVNPGQVVTLTAVLTGTARQTVKTSTNAAFGGTLDADNFNVVIASPNNNDPINNVIVIDFLFGPQTFTNPNIGTVTIPNFVPTTPTPTTFRHYQGNWVPPTPITLLGTLGGQYAGNTGNLDCFQVGPPGNGGSAPFNDIFFSTFKGLHFQDVTASPLNQPVNLQTAQYITCGPADNALSNANIFGNQWWLHRSHPTNSVVLNAHMGFGTPTAQGGTVIGPFPIVSNQYVFSQSTIQSQLPTFGSVNVQLSQNQFNKCQATCLPTCLV